jgi:hypothetical protein
VATEDFPVNRGYVALLECMGNQDPGDLKERQVGQVGTHCGGAAGNVYITMRASTGECHTC